MPNYELDGETLDLETLNTLASGSLTCGLTKAAWDRVVKGRVIVDNALHDGNAYYGINTGVGSQKDCIVDAKDIARFNQHLRHRQVVGSSLSLIRYAKLCGRYFTSNIVPDYESI